MNEFQKILNHPEALHRYWYVPMSDREFFPDAHQVFKLKFDGKLYDLKVNHKGDIMTGELYERYRFLEGDRIMVKRKKDGIFTLDAPDTGLYPKM